MIYADRLAAFASGAKTWQQAEIRVRDYADEIPEWLRGMGDWEYILVGDGGYAACECCGTQRLKVLYAIVPDGDISRPRFIGRECLANLKDMGAVKNQRYTYPVIMWRNRPGMEALEGCNHDR